MNLLNVGVIGMGTVEVRWQIQHLATDSLTTLSTPGRLVFGSLIDIDEEDVVDKSIITTVKDYIDKESAHADVADDKQILASSTMYCLPEEFDLFKGTIRSDLQATYGEHISDYTNFADSSETVHPDAVPCVAVVSAGLTTSQTRIGRIVKRRDKMVEDITGRKAPESKVRAVDTAIGNKLKLGVKSFGGTPTTKSNSVNVDQVLSKYTGTNAQADTTVKQPKKQ